MRGRRLLLRRLGDKPVLNCWHDGLIAVDVNNTRRCLNRFEPSFDTGERVWVASALDYCDREAMSWVATTKSVDACLAGDLMMQAVKQRYGTNIKSGGNAEWLTDNGSCYVAAKTCSFAQELVLKPATTLMRSLQSNGTAESFVRTFKPNYADLTHWTDAQTVMR